MKPTFVVIKDDEEIEVDDTPENRAGAKKKGYEIHELLRSPKGEEVIVPERIAEAALKKGYQFADTYVPPQKRKTEYGGLESGLKGYVDNVSFGLDDEISARAKSVMGGADYDTELKAERAQKKWAQEDNPDEYFGGQIAGGVAGSVLVPGGGAAKGAGIAARLGKNALTGGALGGVSAYGSSKSDTLGGQAKDTIEGAGFGALVGGAVPLAVAGAGKAMRAVPGSEKLLEGAYKKIGEVPDHLAEKIKKNPDIVERAANYVGNAEVTDRIAAAANRMRKEQKELYEKAWNELIKLDKQKPGTVNGQVLANKGIKVAEVNNLFGARQAAQLKASKDLQAAQDDVAKAFSYRQLKTAIDKIDDNINWDIQKQKLSNKVLQQFRTEIDAVLKANPEYKAAMAPLEAKTKAIAELQNKFGLKKGSTTVNGDVEPRFYPTDRTVTQLETQAGQSLALNDKGNYTRDMLKKQAPEVLKEIEARGMEKFMKADIGRGSRSAVLGSAGGFLLDLFGAGGLGTAIGGAAGYARDKVGRSFAVEGLARIGRASASAAQRVGPQIEGILEKAARRGTKAYIVTHQLLLDRSPEYKAAFQEAMNEQ